MKQLLSFILISLSLGMIGLNAQDTPIDQIIAKVDNQIILRSDLEALYGQQIRDGNIRPSDDSFFSKCELLEFLLTNKMLLAKAEIDSVKADPDAVESYLDYQVKVMGLTEKIAEERYGKSIAQIKNEMRPFFEEKLTIQKMESLITQSIDVSPQEVRDYFVGVAMPKVEMAVEVGQIVVIPEESKSLRRLYGRTIGIEIAEEFLDSLAKSIQEQEITFENAARKYSDDRHSRENNGYLRSSETGGSQIFISDLDSYIYFILDTMKVGAISKPLPYRDDEGQTGLRIIYYKSSIPAHQADFDKDYAYLKLLVLQSKREEAIRDWFMASLNSFFIEVIPPYQDCGFWQGN